MNLSIACLNAGACRVADSMGHHIGNLKWIRGAWKFKAIGYDASGELIPGGGPLTGLHNTVFASLDLVQINRVLGSAETAHPTHHEKVLPSALAPAER
jgi:hypothetical protein